MATAAVGGTVASGATKSDIVAGGKTLTLTLTGDTWAPATAGIVFVGSQSGSFAGTTSDQTITMTSLTGGIASAPQAGDLVIVTFGVGGGAGGGSFNASLVIQNTSAVDYTLIGSELNANDSHDANLRVAYRFMPSTPETQFVLVGGTTNTSAAGAWTVHVFRGVDPATPMDVTAVTATGINGRRPNPPSITPSTSGAWMFFAGSGAASATDTFTAGYLSAFESATQSDSVSVITGAGYRAWTSGAYDGAAWGSGTTSTANSWCSVVCALRPSTTTEFDLARQAIIDGLDSAQSEATGWDAVVKAGLSTSNVARTSSTVCTITLPAFASYAITATETITVTIPARALAGYTAIVASPTFTVAATAVANLTLGSVAGVATTSVGLSVPARISMSTADGVATAVVAVKSKSLLALSASTGIATAASFVVTPVWLDPAAAGLSSATVDEIVFLTETVFPVDSEDGAIFAGDADWANAVGGSTASSFFAVTTNALDSVGARISGGDYAVIPYLCRFDTSSLPDNAEIVSVTLSLYGDSAGVAGDTLQARIYDWGSSITTADWQDPTAFSALPLVATIDTGDWVDAAYNDFVDTGDFAANINTSGHTYLYIVSANFANNVAPTDDTSPLHSNYEATDPAKRPILTIRMVGGGQIDLQPTTGVATASLGVKSRTLMSMSSAGVATAAAPVSSTVYLSLAPADGIATAIAGILSGAPLTLGVTAGVSTVDAAVSSPALLSLTAPAGLAEALLSAISSPLLLIISSDGTSTAGAVVTIFFRARVPLGAGTVTPGKKQASASVSPRRTVSGGTTVSIRRPSGHVVLKKKQAGWVVRSGKIAGGTVS